MKAWFLSLFLIAIGGVSAFGQGAVGATARILPPSIVPARAPEAVKSPTEELQEQLPGTRWNWRSDRHKAAPRFVIFEKKQGYFSDNPTNRYNWKAVDGKTVEYGTHRFIFNAGVTEFECPNFAGRGKRWGRRMPAEPPKVEARSLNGEPGHGFGMVRLAGILSVFR